MHCESIYGEIKEDFISNFHNIEEYCVSIEKHHASKYPYHLHAYIKLKECASCVEVREILESITEFGFNVQPCRSRKSVLKYITKEDAEPLFNCSEAELSFAYRARAWARRTPTFRFSDPFVLEHTNKWKYLRELHNEISSFSERRIGIAFNVERWWGGWCMSALLWARDIIAGKGSKAPYLWGEGWENRQLSRNCPELWDGPGCTIPYLGITSSEITMRKDMISYFSKNGNLILIPKSCTKFGGSLRDEGFQQM